MKNFALGMIVFVFAGFAVSCATPARSAVLADGRPVALVSVVSNWDINWHGEAEVNPALIGAASRRALRDDPDLAIISNADVLINSAERILRQAAFASGGLITFSDREELLESNAYRQANLNRRRINSAHSIPDGFRLIDPRDRNFPQALAEEKGIYRSMFVDFTFTKAMRSGFGRNGSGGVNVAMRVQIVDDGGATLYNRTFNVISRDTLRVANGRYSSSELMALFDASILDAGHDFIEHFSDMISRLRF
ncbi:MAG: hypothetical protein FWB82_03205 [Treponema sp.]|nr:hypothetical protein [Treponema sp.]